jgi:hypothetical protein
VTPVDAHRQVLQETHLPPAAAVPVVAGKRDEVEVVDDRQRPREVGNEDDRGLQRGDQNRLTALEVGGDLGAQLRDATLDLLSREVDLPDPRIGYDARSSLYR